MSLHRTTLKRTMNGQNVVQVNTTGILNCDELGYFWIRFSGNSIDLGSGHLIGLGTIFSYQDSQARSVQSVTISTGSQQMGVWVFDMYDSK